MQMINPDALYASSEGFVLELAEWVNWHAPIAVLGLVLIATFAGWMFGKQVNRDR